MNKLTDHKFTKYGYDEFVITDETDETLRVRREVLSQKIFAWEAFNDQSWVPIRSMKEIDELENLFEEWKSNS